MIWNQEMKLRGFDLPKKEKSTKYVCPVCQMPVSFGVSVNEKLYCPSCLARLLEDTLKMNEALLERNIRLNRQNSELFQKNLDLVKNGVDNLLRAKETK